MNKRDEFLLRMYEQLLTTIDRRTQVVWETAGILIGAFAVFALVEKKIVSADYACSLMVLLSAWLVAHAIDATAWFNRNLAIIANIERQFLVDNDAKEIHHYFLKYPEYRTESFSSYTHGWKLESSF